MDEEEVDVVGAQVFQRAGDGGGGAFGLVVRVVDLGGEEDLVARDARGVEGCSDLCLVAVHLRGVDVAVSDVERAANGIVGVFGRDFVGAEAEDWDGGTRGESEGGDGGRGRGWVGGERNVHR